MRFLLALLSASVILAGCASDAARAPATFNAADREPVCARGCLANYSSCVAGVPAMGNNRLIAGDVLNACQSNTRQCLSTCPQK